MRSIYSACKGLGVLGMGVLWVGVLLFLVHSCTEKFPLKIHIFIYVFILVGFPTICCTQLGPQLDILTGSEFLSVGGSEFIYVSVINPPLENFAISLPVFMFYKLYLLRILKFLCL